MMSQSRYVLETASYFDLDCGSTSMYWKWDSGVCVERKEPYVGIWW
jgi:hypothetical protein